ncbi:unnamed protein product [Staurois parvus]|uniref:Ribosomal protein S12 n=1 Tax=Staurois parvus TaxID=386267 RepID=A0ABN9G9S6_9NEOB|nr:unnamed protein product [Staurois parvus]
MRRPTDPGPLGSTRVSKWPVRSCTRIRNKAQAVTQLAGKY